MGRKTIVTIGTSLLSRHSIIVIHGFCTFTLVPVEKARRELEIRVLQHSCIYHVWDLKYTCIKYIKWLLISLHCNCVIQSVFLSNKLKFCLFWSMVLTLILAKSKHRNRCNFIFCILSKNCTYNSVLWYVKQLFQATSNDA